MTEFLYLKLQKKNSFFFFFDLRTKQIYKKCVAFSLVLKRNVSFHFFAKGTEKELNNLEVGT